MSNLTSLYGRVAEHTGLSAEATPGLVSVVLRAVAVQLGSAAVEALAGELPAELATELRKTDHGRPSSAEAVFTRVGRAQKQRRSLAIEHTQVVCQALAADLRPAALHALQQGLPEDLAALFALPQPASSPARPRLDRTHRTLAEGPGGSSHPLFAARADNAQSESVARSENPHGDTKLSTATGLTQEREHESLATARPTRRQL